MSIPYDCISLISTYLTDDDYLNYCHAFDMKPRFDNLTFWYVIRNVMKLYSLELNFRNVTKCINSPPNIWGIISEVVELSEDFIRKFKDDLNWRCILTYQKLSEEFLREFKDIVDWKLVSNYQELSESFMREFKESINWPCISLKQELSAEFILEFKDRVNWTNISALQTLSESTIRQFQDYVDWRHISSVHRLSEDFIRKFKHRVSWHAISFGQNLSEAFIREFEDFVDWEYISGKQKLSQKFIHEFKDRINWSALLMEKRNFKLPISFLEKHINYIDFKCVGFIKLSKEFTQKIGQKCILNNPKYCKEVIENYINHVGEDSILQRVCKKTGYLEVLQFS
ncbi:hypothetical protein ILUMI_05815 [Ignelater luminosus]|uniref:Uncharacterized protein n=1 Tax=Ignelater luminosus TaxID=2038154 RepID=A0A8K0DAE8_IGNLU|nr:hypothetical protein ILUMI_05815 [Ignelater luminosus]